ncbi:hypothetical protein GCM10011491_03800 [Brucella endophytica]|uniref:Uncharacterized protein n=1 Tax=Brucella endophytica TaxID=1963359 RepID=A0A916S3P4_9HYPH|nr:hypothetical protein [Brucella endophytica]GGA79806.1 hypothetical protein GCM10011491_03800 [Brucella endophytica]
MTRKKLCPTEQRFDYENFVYIQPLRAEHQTDEQYEAHCRIHRERAVTLGILRGAAQYAATVLGYHRDCDLAICRRAGACKGRRREDDWLYPYPVAPPCGTGERMEPLRAAVRRIQDAFGEGNCTITASYVILKCGRDVITGEA